MTFNRFLNCLLQYMYFLPQLSFFRCPLLAKHSLKIIGLHIFIKLHLALILTTSYFQIWLGDAKSNTLWMLRYVRKLICLPILLYLLDQPLHIVNHEHAGVYEKFCEFSPWILCDNYFFYSYLKYIYIYIYIFSCFSQAFSESTQWLTPVGHTSLNMHAKCKPLESVR